MEKKGVGRRKFLKTMGIVSASLVMPSGLSSKTTATEIKKNVTMPTRILGNTGLLVSILGLGGSVNWSLNQSLLKTSLNMGITLWDTGNTYLNGKSEIGYGLFLKKYPEYRKKIILMSKSSFHKPEPSVLSEELSLSLERLQTDYIDIYGIIGVKDPSALTLELKMWVEKKKKEGKIRFFGISTHSDMTKMLKKAADLGWIDVVLTSYNYQLVSRDDDLKKAIDICARNGIGIIAMKSQGLEYSRFSLSRYLPVDTTVIDHFMKKGFTLEQAKLKLVWENVNIGCCLSRITNMTILKDNVKAAMDNTKLSSRDFSMLSQLADSNRNFYCKGCMMCESEMKSESMIPDTLRYMMYYNSYNERDEAISLFREIPEDIRRTMQSKDYSPAELICPNKIKIAKAMKEAISILG